MTTDLDLISEKLFSLSTNGGDEYCGAVIGDAVRKLDWGGLPSDMKLIYIAGNESFAQGRISYKETISDALKNGISVNTIFCGRNEEGIDEHWKDGAIAGHGKYFNIDADKKVRYVETPYDDKLEDCNVRMNKTYVSYGATGVKKRKIRQRKVPMPFLYQRLIMLSVRSVNQRKKPTKMIVGI